MPSLSKIIKKINRKKEINSVKGIKSKLESINWESVADAELKEQAEKKDYCQIEGKFRKSIRPK